CACPAAPSVGRSRRSASLRMRTLEGDTFAAKRPSGSSRLRHGRRFAEECVRNASDDTSEARRAASTVRRPPGGPSEAQHRGTAMRLALSLAGLLVVLGLGCVGDRGPQGPPGQAGGARARRPPPPPPPRPAPPRG